MTLPKKAVSYFSKDEGRRRGSTKHLSDGSCLYWAKRLVKTPDSSLPRNVSRDDFCHRIYERCGRGDPVQQSLLVNRFSGGECEDRTIKLINVFGFSSRGPGKPRAVVPCPSNAVQNRCNPIASNRRKCISRKRRNKFFNSNFCVIRRPEFVKPRHIEVRE